MNTFRNIQILMLCVLIITFFFIDCVSKRRFLRELNERDCKIDSLQAVIKPDQQIKIIDSRGNRINQINLSDQFGVEVSGFAPNAKFSFTLKTESREVIRDDIEIETNSSGEGRNFVAWHGLDDYDALPDTLQQEIKDGIIIEANQLRGSSENIDAFLPPKLVYTSDENGNMRNSFIQLRDAMKIHLTLEGFPPNSSYIIYLTRRTNWYQGRPIYDIRNLPEEQRITIGNEKQTIDLWEREGLYGWGNGKLSGGFNVLLVEGEKPITHFDSTLCQIYNSWGSLFVIQRFSDEDRIQNLTRYAEEYHSEEKMRIGVDPKNSSEEQPQYLIHATIYFVVDIKWSDGMKIPKDSVVLADVIPVRPGCININQHIIPAPKEEGKYDIIVDINNDERYTKGIDIIDGIDGPGFKVVPNPETLLATISKEMNSIHIKHKSILQIELKKKEPNTRWFRITPNIESSSFLKNDYRYDKLNEVEKMLNVVSTEVIEYLKDYEVDYTIGCYGKLSNMDTLGTFIYPQYEDDEPEINYNPPPHSPFHGNNLRIRGGTELETFFSLALLRAFYLYRSLIKNGAITDYVGIDKSQDNDLKPFIEIKIDYQTSVKIQ